MTQTAGTAEPARAARPDKRRRILDAAAPIFGREGYERASVDGIAAAAGVSKPTIYTYFGNKEQLFRDSVADSARTLNEDSVRAVAELDLAPDCWEASLRRLALRLTMCQRSECASALGRLVNAEIARDPQVFRMVREAGYLPVVDALAGRLAMLGNAGYLRLDDPHLSAKQFLALVLAEFPDLTLLGTRSISHARMRVAVDLGVDTFLRAQRLDA